MSLWQGWQGVLSELRGPVTVRTASETPLWSHDDLFVIVIREMGDEIDRLKAEFAAAQSEPPRPAAIVRTIDREAHGFECTTDAIEFYSSLPPDDTTDHCRAYMGFRSWTWHPKKGGG